MNESLTEIVVVVDRSGSMEAIWTKTLEGLRNFVDEQRKLPGDARLTLVAFDDQYLVPFNRVPIGDVDLSEPAFGPRGGTALYDALGRTITSIGEALFGTPEPDRPGRVIVAVLTDGQENSSQDFTRQQVFELIRRQEEVYSWTFLFLAAGQDALDEASNLGLAFNRTVMYQQTDEDTRAAYSTMNQVVSQSRSRSSSEQRSFASEIDLDEALKQQKRRPPKK